MTNELDDLLTIAEAAAAPRVCKTTFRQRLSHGEPDRPQVVGAERLVLTG
jgi:hypothetical protein